MSLAAGTRLGLYEILAPLGVGGMGEVYRARDPRLNRVIAIKILPQATAADPDVRARFEREAQSVAALNHPNIVTIHSVEEADGLLFLTMEVVEGKPLSEAMAKGGLSLELILKLAIQLADAVRAAHERGVTHRDLKPTNVMVTPDGRVKVLDFGLAKLKEGQPAEATLTAAPTQLLTGQGQIVGTVAYMSPEQAEGKTVDHRSDVFSLGIILYEMATGERPFMGDSNLSVLSAILRDTPRAVTEVNRALPRELSRIIRHCLAKDPARRYQTAADLRNELEELKQDLDSGEISAGGTQQPTAASGPRRRLLPAAAALVALVVLAAIVVFVVRAPRPAGESSQAPAARVEAAVTRLTTQSGVEHFPSLSPDGGWIVYSSGEPGSEDIYLRSVAGQTSINLTKDSTESDTEPAFSPDGERIAFRSERQGGGIFVMGRTGESPRRLTEVGFNPAWSPDGNDVLYATENVVDSPFNRNSISQLWAVKVATGGKTRLSEGDAVQPRWSPHGHRIAYWARALSTGAQRDIYTIPAAGGEAHPVTSDAALDWNPVWSPDGRYLYFSSNRGGSLNLWRVPIDEQSGKTLGQPEAITTPSPYVAHLSFSADGQRLVYASIVVTSNIQKAAFDPATETVKGEPTWVTRGSKIWNAPGLSPDGEWLAFATFREQEDIFISRSDGSSLRQLTNDPANDRVPRWSPDGKRIAFYSARSGSYQVWIIDPDGSGLQQITEYTGPSLNFSVWSPDGSRMATSDQNQQKVFIFEPRKPWKEQTPQLLPPPPAGENFAALSWSPDGRWLAGTDRPHPGHPRGGIVIYSLQSQTYQRLTDFGLAPVWLSDSRRLLFDFQGKLFLVDSQSKRSHELLSVAGETLSGPSLSRDDREIYFTRGTNEADIWMATLK